MTNETEIKQALEFIKNNIESIKAEIDHQSKKTPNNDDHAAFIKNDIDQMNRVVNFDFDSVDIDTLSRRAAQKARQSACMITGINKNEMHNLGLSAVQYLFGRNGVAA